MSCKKPCLERSKWLGLFASVYDEKNFLFFFRTAVCLVALIELGSLATDLRLFFAPSGTIIPQELMYLQTGDFKYLNRFYSFLLQTGLVDLFYSSAPYLYALSLLFLLFGLFTRYAAVVALMLQLLMYQSFSHFNYGYDNFMTMSLFYCIVFPVGKHHSVDRRLFPRRLETAFNYQRVVQIHLATAYFFSGIAKGLDPGWWNGDSVCRALASLDNAYYLTPAVLLVLVGIGAVLLEFLYPFLVYFRKTRKYAVAGIVLMHAGIAVMMDLYAFSAIMIVWNVAAFGDAFRKEGVREVHPA